MPLKSEWTKYSRTVRGSNDPCTESIILFSNLIEIENYQFLVFIIFNLKLNFKN